MSRNLNNGENQSLIQLAKEFFSKNWTFVLVASLAFMAVISIIYFDTTTSETVASFRLDEFEVGQISDRNIIATNSIPPDEFFPFAIEEGEKVIKKGFPITEEGYQKLEKMSQSHGYVDYRLFADKALFLILVLVFWVILFSPSLLRKSIQLKELILEVVLFFILIVLTALSDKTPFFQDNYNLCIATPAALSSFIIAILFGQASAFSFACLSTLGVLCASNFAIIPTLFVLATSIAASRIVSKIERRTDMIFASIFLSVFNVVFTVLLKVIFNGKFNSFFLFSGIALNGFFSGILALGLLTLLETILNTASVFRLMDLSDENTPALQELLVLASGTYQHSKMVAQLAENGCKIIGANSLLARVGALYHDIGKTEHPEYFTENQDGKSLHDDIKPSLSATVIKSHVKLGLEKAKALHLPQQVIDIISEHHGNSVISFFYNKAKEADPNVSEEDFSYPGVPPITRESAVVMLADTVEAACKSLDKPSVPRLEKFIQTLIDSKVANHQLDNSGLTFGELTKLKDEFVRILAAYYHSRIKYPNQKDPDEIENKPSESENKNEGESVSEENVSQEKTSVENEASGSEKDGENGE